MNVSDDATFEGLHKHEERHRVSWKKFNVIAQRARPFEQDGRNGRSPERIGGVQHSLAIGLHGPADCFARARLIGPDLERDCRLEVPRQGEEESLRAVRGQRAPKGRLPEPSGRFIELRRGDDRGNRIAGTREVHDRTGDVFDRPDLRLQSLQDILDPAPPPRARRIPSHCRTRST
jgi:hypothetical protein